MAESTRRGGGLTLKRTEDSFVLGELTIEDVQYILIYYTENSVAGKHMTWEEVMNR